MDKDFSWGYFESLFLMRIYELIKTGKMSQDNAIHELNITLKKWSAAHGGVIESEVRTDDEIAWQLERIGYLVHNPELPTTQKFMKKVVDLYIKQPLAYRKEIKRIYDRGFRIGNDMITMTSSAQNEDEDEKYLEEQKTDEEQLCVVDFTKEQSYRFTKAVRLIYFNEEYEISHWKRIYVQLARCLYDDFTDKISLLLYVKVRGLTNVFCNKKDKDKFQAPKQVAENLYIETNLGADAIVRKMGNLLVACGVDFENVKIEYKKVSNNEIKDSDTNTKIILNNKAGDKGKRRILFARTCFEEEEVILLIEACILVNKGIISHKECLSKLSEVLRAMAIDKGYKIDDSYRSAAGLSGCLWSISKLIDNEEIDCKFASRVYQNVVWLYKNVPSRFLKKLSEIHDAGYNILSSRKENKYRDKQIDLEHTLDNEKKSKNDDNLSYERIISVCFVAQALYLKSDIDVFQNQRKFMKLINDYAERQGKSQRWLFIEVGRRIQKIYAAINSRHPDMESLNQIDKEMIAIYHNDRNNFDRYMNDGLKAIGWDTKEMSAVNCEKPVSATSTLSAEEGKPNVHNAELIDSSKTLPYVEERDTASLNIPSDISNNCVAEYNDILKNYFPRGYKVGKMVYQRKFINRYEETYGKPIPCTEEKLDANLMKAGCYRDNCIFARADDDQKEYVQKLLKTINETLGSGASCLYIKCIFDHEREKLQHILKIYDENALTKLLQRNRNNIFCIDERGRIYRKSCSPDPGADVRRLFHEKMRPLTYQQAGHILWYIPMEKIKQTVRQTSNLLRIENNTYMDFDAVPLVKEDWRQIHDVIMAALAISSSGHLSKEECRKEIYEALPNVATNTESLSTSGFMQALAYQFGDEFSFTGSYVSADDTEVRPQSLIEEFCEDHEFFTFDDYSDFLEECQIPERYDYYDILYKKAIRLNENEFIKSNQIDFDIEATDTAIERFGFCDFAPLHSIASRLSLLPAINHPWNEYLLESYIYNHSKKYELVHSHFTRKGSYGAIVCRDSSLEKLDDVLMQALACDNSWNNQAEALHALVVQGYIERARYTKLNDILPHARKLRAENNDD